jgi:CheY-like chemotaxis protein
LPHILLVEDDQPVIDFIMNNLGKLKGFKVTHHWSVEEALEAIMAGDVFDASISDGNLPGELTGANFHTILRRRQGLPNWCRTTPFFGHTTQNNPWWGSAWIDPQFFCVQKPDTTELLKRIRSYFNVRNQSKG